MQISKDIYVVDNFYNNPNVIRDIAISAAYPTYDKCRNFAGQESEKSYYTEKHKEAFEDILKKEIIISPELYIYGKFRYSLKGDNSRTLVHLDWNVDWTAIIYLSLDKDIKGELGIYRMKDYSLDKRPNDSVLRDKFNCNSIKEFDAKYIMPNTKLIDKWELLHSIQIKYNRLILFKGSEYFHGITEQFGDNIRNGRLTQTFFFNENEN